MGYRALDHDTIKNLLSRGADRQRTPSSHPFFANLQKASFVSAPASAGPKGMASTSVGRLSQHKAVKGEASPNKWYRENAFSLRTKATPSSMNLNTVAQTRDAQASIRSGMMQSMTPNKGKTLMTPRAPQGPNINPPKVPTSVPGSTNANFRPPGTTSTKAPSAPSVKTSSLATSFRTGMTNVLKYPFRQAWKHKGKTAVGVGAVGTYSGIKGMANSNNRMRSVYAQTNAQSGPLAQRAAQRQNYHQGAGGAFSNSYRESARAASPMTYNRQQYQQRPYSTQQYY